ALRKGRPEVFNTDQGVQFTAEAWTGRLEAAGVQVSLDGKGRCLDNVFVERLWRTVKKDKTIRDCSKEIGFGCSDFAGKTGVLSHLAPSEVLPEFRVCGCNRLARNRGLSRSSR